MELNPVRAGLIATAHDYPWSSAKSHVSGIADGVLYGTCFLDETVRDWKEYLSEAPDTEAEAGMFESTKTGRPCGKNEFVKQVEDVLGRRFKTRSAGRPCAHTDEKEDGQIIGLCP